MTLRETIVTMYEDENLDIKEIAKAVMESPKYVIEVLRENNRHYNEGGDNDGKKRFQ